MANEFWCSTNAILVNCALNHAFGERLVDWAVMMLENGHDSMNLCILEGESPPYNQFQLRELADKTFRELGLDWSDNELIVDNYVVELLEEMLAGKNNLKLCLEY